MLPTSLAALTLALSAGCTITVDDLGMSGDGDDSVSPGESSDSDGSDGDTGDDPTGASWGPATDGSGGVSASGDDGNDGTGTDGNGNDGNDDNDDNDDNGDTAGPTGVLECSIWDETCPDGYKCVPWSWDDSGVLNATVCRQLFFPFDEVGEPCMVLKSPLWGSDTCGDRAMCFHDDPTATVGTCIEFCAGSPEEPVCDAGFQCSTSKGGLVNLCTAVAP